MNSAHRDTHGCGLSSIMDKQRHYKNRKKKERNEFVCEIDGFWFRGTHGRNGWSTSNCLASHQSDRRRDIWPDTLIKNQFTNADVCSSPWKCLNSHEAFVCKLIPKWKFVNIPSNKCRPIAWVMLFGELNGPTTLKCMCAKIGIPLTVIPLQTDKWVLCDFTLQCNRTWSN